MTQYVRTLTRSSSLRTVFFDHASIAKGLGLPIKLYLYILAFSVIFSIALKSAPIPPQTPPVGRIPNPAEFKKILAEVLRNLLPQKMLSQN